MVKVRTTINIDEQLIDLVKESGVKNVSGHIEKLLRHDLKEVEKVGASELRKVDRLNEKLDEVEVEWNAYLKEQGEIGKRSAL